MPFDEVRSEFGQAPGGEGGDVPVGGGRPGDQADVLTQPAPAKAGIIPARPKEAKQWQWEAAPKDGFHLLRHTYPQGLRRSRQRKSRQGLTPPGSKPGSKAHIRRELITCHLSVHEEVIAG
ncbi:hypothetical protein AB0D04_11415 [Streptomyces sp. NPDC048483]|uniref:hypothetical protein n=1 Tax=Streptomyces sp. NPDC048483 TaxID=3154927 RepID=UPI003420CFC4